MRTANAEQRTAEQRNILMGKIGSRPESAWRKRERIARRRYGMKRDTIRYFANQARDLHRQIAVVGGSSTFASANNRKLADLTPRSIAYAAIGCAAVLDSRKLRRLLRSGR